MTMRNVLAVLEDGEDQLWRTFETAVALADCEHACLTLAKTTAGSRGYVWLSPFAFGAAYLPPPVDSWARASQVLARVVERVPESMPVTTIVLEPCVERALRELICRGGHDALVVGPKLLAHHHRLARDLQRRDVVTVTTAGGESGLAVLRRVLDSAGFRTVPLRASRRRPRSGRERSHDMIGAVR